ncbi:MAG: hypothetical protein ACFFBD_02395 [Candidatus Hodarchaeota archaeon]
MSVIIKEILNAIKEHIIFACTLFILFVLGVILIVTRFEGPAFSVLDPIQSGNPYNYTLFGLSLVTLILLLSIAFFLLNRYLKTEKENFYQLVWGLAFLFYSWTFVGLIFRSIGLDFGGLLPLESTTTGFFIWRQGMIFWATFVWIGLSSLLTDRKEIQYIPAAVIFAVSEIWFVIGLLLMPTIFGIEATMYGFLFLVFVPNVWTLAYLWYLFSKKSNLTSGYVLMAGFVWLGFTYVMWAPWHYSHLVYIYFVWFCLFVLSLAIILLGMVMLPLESQAQQT